MPKVWVELRKPTSGDGASRTTAVGSLLSPTSARTRGGAVFQKLVRTVDEGEESPLKKLSSEVEKCCYQHSEPFHRGSQANKNPDNLSC